MAHKTGTHPLPSERPLPRLPEHLQRRENGVYHFRMRVPEKLQAIIGKSTLRQSLKTTNLAEAKRGLPILRMQANSRLDDARRRLAAEGQAAEKEQIETLSEDQVWSLAMEWLVEKLKEDAPLSASQVRATDRLDELSYLTDPNDTNGSSAALQYTKKFLAQRGITLSVDSHSFRRLANLIHEAMIEREKRMVRRFVGASAADLNPSFNGISAATPCVSRPTLKLADLIERFETDLAQRPGVAKTKLKRAAHFKLLIDLIGAQTPLSKIDRTKARSVFDAVSKLPANATKLFRGATAAEVLALASSSPRPPMNPATANGYLIAFSALMKFAVNEHLIDRNPAEGLRVASDGVRAKQKRLPFSVDELNRIFAAPLYRGCLNDAEGYSKPGSERPRRSRFWIPLIGLFSGMRLNEICQLFAEDVATIAGVDVFLVRLSDDGSKSVKTDAGIRLIPVHPELKRLGFLSYANEKRSRGVRLFPELTIAKSGYASDNFSKWYAHFLDHLGITDRRKNFHSFRHNFKDALSAGNVPQDRRKLLGGWSDGDTEERYGGSQEIEAVMLSEEIGKVRYDGLRLDFG